MVRKATQQDQPAAVALWQLVFGDDEPFVQSALSGFVGWENLYVYEQQGEIAAILNAVPCEAAGSKGIYLYALATHPAHCGKGIMSQLMQAAEADAEAQGAAFASLIPASLPLYAWYGKRGYHDEATLCRLEWRPEPWERKTSTDRGHIIFIAATALPLERLRSDYLPQAHLRFDAGRTRQVLNDLEESGIKAAMGPNAYALYVVRPDGLLVAELGAADDESAAGLVFAIMDKEKPPKNPQGLAALITLPSKSHLLAGMQTEVRAGLIKPLRPDFDAGPVYIRFAMDEI